MNIAIRLSKALFRPQVWSLLCVGPFPCREWSCAKIKVFWLLCPQFCRGLVSCPFWFALPLRGLKIKTSVWCELDNMASCFAPQLGVSCPGPSPLPHTISSRELPEQLTMTMLIDEYCNSALQASSSAPPLCRPFPCRVRSCAKIDVFARFHMKR